MTPQKCKFAQNGNWNTTIHGEILGFVVINNNTHAVIKHTDGLRVNSISNVPLIYVYCI